MRLLLEKVWTHLFLNSQIFCVDMLPTDDGFGLFLFFCLFSFFCFPQPLFVK